LELSGGRDEYAAEAEFYDLVSPYRARRDVAFFVEASRGAAGPVLELGCGTGRVLIPSARAGARITGLDASSAMLAVCRQKLEEEPEDVQSRATLVRGDMRDFNLHREFELVTIPFRPFQHLLDMEDQLACLAAIHRHLAPGGKLILDIFNPAVDRLGAPPTPPGSSVEDVEFALPDGRRVLRRVRVLGRDIFRQIHDVEFTYLVTLADGREQQHVHEFRLRYLHRYEAEHLLARSGFAVEDLFSDYDKSPYGAQYPGELIFTARKAGGRPT
jgi:SAM-dependent methyltransferase